MDFVGPVKWTEVDDTDACPDSESGSGAGADHSPG